LNSYFLSEYSSQYLNEDKTMQTRLIRLKAVMTMTGLSRSGIYKYISEDRFPQSVNLGTRAIGFVEQEVNRWIEQRIEDRDSNVLSGYDVETEL
jgi:prophage regulatory protein